jgi:hypothetical protein
MKIEPTGIVALYAAIISTFALGLEVRRWFESGPRLKIRYMAPAMVIGGYPEDSTRYISVTISNNGNQATTITHLIFYGYDNLLTYILRKQSRQLFIPNPQLNSAPLPHVLEAGKEWSGSATYEDKMKSELRERAFWSVGVSYSYSKNPKLTRLKVNKDNQDAQKTEAID